MSIHPLLDKIAFLTNKQRKLGRTKEDITLALIEEIGEFSSAILIENNTIGKQYKKLNEPSYVELVDIFICMCSLDYLEGRVNCLQDLFNSIHDNENIKEIMEYQCDYLYMIRIIVEYITVCEFSGFYPGLYKYILFLYIKYGGKYNEFLTIAKSKVDKWEKTLENNPVLTKEQLQK